MIKVKGRGVSPGLGTGRVVRRGDPVRAEGHGADFDGARRIAAERYRNLADKAAGKGAGEMADLFEAYLQMLEDPDLEDGVLAGIAEGAEPAEAVAAAGEELARMLRELDDEYMKERAADILSVCRDLADIMTGRDRISPIPDSPTVLLARDLSPADTLELDTAHLKALVLKEGSPNGHTAILAQLLGIPAVIGAGDALDAAEDGMTAREAIKRGFVVVGSDLPHFHQSRPAGLPAGGGLAEDAGRL